MKIKFILLSMLAAAALASCSKEAGVDQAPVDSSGVAYLSLRVETQKETRASGEDPGANESDLESIYVLTFDDTETIVAVPGTSDYYIKVTTASPDAMKVSASATKLLVVANPGAKLLSVLNGINSTTIFSTINQAISDVTHAEITDDVANITKGFAMINGGDESGLTAGQKITTPLIPIGSHIKKISDFGGNESQAKAAAEAARVTVKIERLASKLEFKLKGTINVLPAGADFVFGNWTVDAVNSTFYPFAEKTILSVTHNQSASYVKNFYTKDPNFANNTGIRYTTINTSGDYSPQLVAPYSWMAASAKAYTLENTMDAPEQLFERATRIVVKGTYYPKDYTGPAKGDWFSFAGKNYSTLADLQAACLLDNAVEAACDKMFAKIKAYATANSIGLTGTDFATLTQADLDQIPNGGEVIKNGKDVVIRWYQKGLNYYYYEIRHDNENEAEMAFGKYGVVRNNWYSLTLGEVKGAGTPWYPDINNPGPGDPNPKDPIDTSAGYLGITVEVAKWILWGNEISI